MTVLEDRLRRELPQLADALIALEEPVSDGSSDGHADLAVTAFEPAPPRKRRRLAIVAAAAAGVLVLALVPWWWPRTEHADVATDPSQTVPATDVPTSFGTWSTMAEAPIATRPYAVTAWTGTEAIFWAGSSLERLFAHTDGAAYDPATDTWRHISTPGWGHPGLTSDYFDGDLYALAKGSGSKLDLIEGVWSDLPRVEGMWLAATVATDDAIWGLGPAAVNPEDQPDLAIARYDSENDTWEYGPVYETTEETAAIIQGVSRLESTVHWFGSEIIVWGGIDGGVAFEPSSETWRIMDPPEPTEGEALAAIATVTDAGFVVLTSIDPETGAVAVLGDDGWRWAETEIPIDGFDSVTVAAAGEWIVIFSAGSSPTTLHVPSGEWDQRADGPLGGVQGPNAVWTGSELIVWGGQADDPSAPGGAVWTPPA